VRVHERKRGARLEPATVVPVFFAPNVAPHPRALDFPWLLLSRTTKPTAPLNLTGDIELVVSMLMTTIDNRLNPALHRKGNAAVTFDSLSCAKPVVEASVAKTTVLSIAVTVITVLNVSLVNYQHRTTPRPVSLTELVSIRAAASLLFVPVHVRKRGDHLKSATPAQLFFFAPGRTLKIPWPC
jgi:hypothetical protein